MTLSPIYICIRPGRTAGDDSRNGALHKHAGCAYIVISDHSRSLGIANGLSIEQLREQAAEIKSADAEMGDDFRILHGTEMEIKADGTLDYPDDVLAELDFVIASLHVSLSQTRDQVMKRVFAAR